MAHGKAVPRQGLEATWALSTSSRLCRVSDFQQTDHLRFVDGPAGHSYTSDFAAGRTVIGPPVSRVTHRRRTSVTDANSRTTAYQYDDADRLLAVTDAAGNSTLYGYDTENHLASITDALGRATNFGYDPLGRVTQVTFPSSLTES